MIPFGYQAYGTTSPTLLRGRGRRTECPSGGDPPASVPASVEPADSRSEEEVGTKLFVRSQSGMRLTEAGRTFLKEARSILAQSQRAVQLAQAASRGEAGRLDIAYAVEGFEPVLLRVIRLFRGLFPMVELGIRELRYHQQVQRIF